METQKYQRRPIYVQAVRVTEENFTEVAQWCQGGINMKHGTTLDNLRQDKTKFIKVRVINPQRVRQTKAYVGDWVLYSEYNGYKVYTNGAFENSFMPVEEGKHLSIQEARDELQREFEERRKEEAPGDEQKEPLETNGAAVTMTQHPEKDELVPDGTYGGARPLSQYTDTP